MKAIWACGLLVAGSVVCAGQAAPAQPEKQDALPPPQGQVLFERHAGDAAVAQTGEKKQSPVDQSPVGQYVEVSGYDLDVLLRPAANEIEVRGRLTLKNITEKPVSAVALDVSSSLTWAGRAQQAVVTDADHTGAASETVVTLDAPLAPGASRQLTVLYGGKIAPDATRLTRIGAGEKQSAYADWDAVSSEWTGLRGFGDVLWLPVSAPPVLLGEGAKLFDAVNAERARGHDVQMHMRLRVEYEGEPPVAAYINGRRVALTATSDDAEAPTAAGHGIATGEFAEERIGFRVPSLFLVGHAEELTARLGANSSSAAGAVADGSPLLAVETDDAGVVPRLSDGVESAGALVSEWLGGHPMSALTLLDHDGQPFEDGPLLVAPASAMSGSSAYPALAHALTHAWVQTGQPWVDEGLAQFMGLIATERQAGREAAIAALAEAEKPLTLAEPDLVATPGAAVHPLMTAESPVFYRTKAAAVWWMLREIVGEQPMKDALRTIAAAKLADDPKAAAAQVQAAVEASSKMQLGWFFRSWVLEDRGLPDLVIADVTPRLLPAGQGHDAGWLVAVTVRNEGLCEAEVPLVVRSKAGERVFSTRRRVRVPGNASVTERILVEAEPTEIELNDGSVPEVRSTTHVRDLRLSVKQ